MSKANCVNIERNEENCPCPSTDCERRAVCCDCISAHAGKDSLPSCLKSKIQESQPFREHVVGLVEQVNSS